jgi:predicted permease
VIFIVVATFLVCWLIGSLVAVPPKLIWFAERYVLNFALPAVIIAKMTTVDVTSELLIPVLVAWASMLGCAVAVYCIGRLRQWSRDTVGALLLVAVLGNTSFLGLGMVSGLLGADHLSAAIAYDQLGTFLGLAIYGSYISGRFGTGDSGGRAILHRLSRFGPFLALLTVIPLRVIGLDADIVTVLNDIGYTVAPVAMGALGLRFTLRVDRAVIGPALTGLFIKMVAVPGVVVLAAVVFASTGDLMWSTSILESAAPPMVTAGVVAIAAGFDEKLVAFVVGVGTLAAFAWLPFVSLAL